MGHIIRWDNAEKTVVLQEYVKPATKDDLYQLAKKSNAMLSSVSHTVHLIIDERNIDLILSTPDMDFLEDMTPKNQGLVILVLQDQRFNYKNLVQFLGKRLAPTAFKQTNLANSIAEARQYLIDNFNVNYDATYSEDEHKT